MLFFALFALCYSQTTQYCYTQVKSGNDVVGYAKTPKGTENCPEGSTVGDKDPKLTKDYVCVETGKMCGEGADNKPTVTKCVMYDKCVVLGEDKMKFTLNGQKVKVTEYSKDNCPSDDIAQESNEYDCGSCNEKGDIDDKYTCNKAAAAEPTTPKYCYAEKKSTDGKVFGYDKKPQVDGECPAGLEVKDKEPEKLKEYTCYTKVTACPVNETNVIEKSCRNVDTCITNADGKTSYRYEVDGDKLKISEFPKAECGDKATTKEYACGKCEKVGNDFFHADCGAIETAVLLLIAFIFFFF